MMRSLLPQSNSTSPLGWRIRKKPTGIVTFPLEPFCRIDLSSVSPPDENTYSFTSFGGSAACTAVAIIAVAAIEPRNRILARLARIVSSQGCTIMFLITKYILARLPHIAIVDIVHCVCQQHSPRAEYFRSRRVSVH